MISTPGKYLIGLLTGLLLLAAAYFEGRKAGRASVAPLTLKEYIVVEKEIEKKTVKNKKTVKKKPDGTVTVITESEKEVSTEHVQKQKLEEATLSPQPAPDWAVGGSISYSKSMSIILGKRVLGDIWTVVQVPLDRPQDSSVGLSVQF